MGEKNIMKAKRYAFFGMTTGCSISIFFWIILAIYRHEWAYYYSGDQEVQTVKFLN